MRILHVTTYLRGGAGRVISSLAIAQLRLGHDVRVAVDTGGEPGYASYPRIPGRIDGGWCGRTDVAAYERLY